MTTIFTWNIANLERETADGYVFTAHYTVDAKDDTYSAGAYGSIGLERPAENMIPFADLTPEIVTGWVREKFGPEKVAEIEVALQKQIDEQRNPTVASGVPWNNVAGVAYEPTVLTAADPAPVVDVIADSTPVVNDTTSEGGV